MGGFYYTNGGGGVWQSLIRERDLATLGGLYMTGLSRYSKLQLILRNINMTGAGVPYINWVDDTGTNQGGPGYYQEIDYGVENTPVSIEKNSNGNGHDIFPQRPYNGAAFLNFSCDNQNNRIVSGRSFCTSSDESSLYSCGSDSICRKTFTYDGIVILITGGASFTSGTLDLLGAK